MRKFNHATVLMNHEQVDNWLIHK